MTVLDTRPPPVDRPQGGSLIEQFEFGLVADGLSGNDNNASVRTKSFVAPCNAQ